MYNVPPRRVILSDPTDDDSRPDPGYKPPRPAGVTLLAVLHFVGAALGVILLLFVLTRSPAPPPDQINGGALGTFGIPSAESYMQSTYTLFGLIGVILIAIGLIMGIGMWRLES